MKDSSTQNECFAYNQDFVSAFISNHDLKYWDDRTFPTEKPSLCDRVELWQEMEVIKVEKHPEAAPGTSSGEGDTHNFDGRCAYWKGRYAD